MTEEDIDGLERLAKTGGETYHFKIGEIPCKTENMVHVQCAIILDLCAMARSSVSTTSIAVTPVQEPA